LNLDPKRSGSVVEIGKIVIKARTKMSRKLAQIPWIKLFQGDPKPRRKLSNVDQKIRRRGRLRSTIIKGLRFTAGAEAALKLI
jgi:hypothetical protein